MEDRKRIEVLDKGYVELIDYMGNDLAIINAARVSYNKESAEFSENDKKLLKYLWDNKHSTPFEMVVFKFRVKAPIFVARQWFRHRMASYNEISRRYTSNDIDFHIPNGMRQQAETNKQASKDSFIDNSDEAIKALQISTINCLNLYNILISNGACREQARIILPQNMYTEFYYLTNLRSLINFLELRDDKHAQKEIQEYAKAIKTILSSFVPNTMEIVFNGGQG